MIKNSDCGVAGLSLVLRPTNSDAALLIARCRSDSKCEYVSDCVNRHKVIDTDTAIFA